MLCHRGRMAVGAPQEFIDGLSHERARANPRKGQPRTPIRGDAQMLVGRPEKHRHLFDKQAERYFRQRKASAAVEGPPAFEDSLDLSLLTADQAALQREKKS